MSVSTIYDPAQTIKFRWNEINLHITATGTIPRVPPMGVIRGIIYPKQPKLIVTATICESGTGVKPTDAPALTGNARYRYSFSQLYQPDPQNCEALVKNEQFVQNLIR